MSNHSRALVVFLFMLAIGAAATISEDFKANVGRQPTSIRSKKEMILGEVRAPILRHTNKIQPSVHVAIELDGAKPEKAGDVFVVRGVIKADETLEHVDFKWALPSDVEVINGEVHGELAQISHDNDVELRLTLKTRTGENHQIHLTAGATARGARFSNTVQYNTLIQDLLNASREELRKSTEAQASKEQILNGGHGHDHSEFKVFQ